jgi:hypothetical protein
MRTKKTQNIKINMTCGSDFRLKKLYLFLHIFVIFSREISRLGTSPPMMKSVWSHLNDFVKSYMLGSHIYYTNSFSAWQISGNDIIKNLEADWLVYKQTRNKVNIEMKKAKKDYYSKRIAGQKQRRLGKQ